ncbi:hypothetical protein [Natronosalvus caseinilyticus]|uniref:hypothetical protein n=1 Tax=Natronosalvus caseinilyticus TaxID=2953747 RepID=UPI0028B02709|nr:hypothetical protein [Natronosalvus caseinilyticus]
MSPSAEPPDRSTPRKSMLICFACGHESPLEANWIRRVHDDTTDIECPACGTTITSRPSSVDPVPESEGALCYRPGD